MFIQHIPNWNKGVRIINTELENFPNGEYIYFSEEFQAFLDPRDEEYYFEVVDLMSDKWELFPTCPHCNGTGILESEKPSTKKGKKK